MTKRTKATPFITLVIILSALFIFAIPVNAATTTTSGSAVINFTGGQLTLDSVPTFTFPTSIVPSTDTSYQATSVGSALQLTDVRGGVIPQGWNIQAQLSSFQQSGSNTLAGSKLTLNNGTATEIGSTGAISPTIASASITLNAGAASPTPIVSAAQGAGVGQWQIVWLANKVNLSVVASTITIGNHTAVLNWVLTDTP